MAGLALLGAPREICIEHTDGLFLGRQPNVVFQRCELGLGDVGCNGDVFLDFPWASKMGLIAEKSKRCAVFVVVDNFFKKRLDGSDAARYAGYGLWVSQRSLQHLVFDRCRRLHL